MLTSEIDKIDFEQVVITSSETLTYSADGSKTVIEWTDIEPTFLSELSYKDGPYDLEQMQQITQSTEWQPKEQDEETDTFISPIYPTGLTNNNFGATGATGNTGATGLTDKLVV
jgi:hypothetical protein